MKGKQLYFSVITFAADDEVEIFDNEYIFLKSKEKKVAIYVS